MSNIIIRMYSQQFCKDVTFVLGDRNFILDKRRVFLLIKMCGFVEFQLNASLLNGNRTKLLPYDCKHTKSTILRRHSALYCQFPTVNRGHHLFAKHAIGGTISSNPPGRQLNSVLESDCAVLVFRLKSYLTRQHFILVLSSGILEKLCIINAA